MFDNCISQGEVSLGIELGSTRIKAVLINVESKILAVGSHTWENSLIDGVWTYSLEDVEAGVQAAFADLQRNVEGRYGVRITNLKTVGVSAMMHGYLAFDADDQLLVPFRTWRNTMTEAAAEELSELFGMNIPQRWSVAHYYQAVLNGESHVSRVSFLTTLAGYVHWKLTGIRALGVGDASGMFPIGVDGNYDQDMARLFDERLAQRTGKASTASVLSLLPPVLSAGQAAGELSPAGARYLDPSGELQPGALACPPEGDAGTGMVATNAVTAHTGNVSVGTSVFAMVVLDQPLAKSHLEIDVVATPDGKPVAMVHCNNGTTELDEWVGVFREFASMVGVDVATSDLYDMLYKQALGGATDADGVVAFNYLSGEPITGTSAGMPMYVRELDSRLTLSHFIRAQLMGVFATLRLGMDILTVNEGVVVTELVAHGGVFKTPKVAQSILAAALDIPITVREGAGEGGAWGIAVLANYLRDEFRDLTLSDYLEGVFADNDESVRRPVSADVEGFDGFLANYRRALPAQRMLTQR